MHRSLFLLGAASLFLGACQNVSQDPILSQTYVHKYGFDVSEKEWQERTQDGQIITVLKDGVKKTESYENGVLHGLTTYTFPHSNTIERSLAYDQGSLLKETVFDAKGVPLREEIYEFDDRTIITLWDEMGVPLSIEEYEGELLVEGKYYTPDHSLEGEVLDGTGTRIKRDRSGLLLLKDQIENGIVSSRVTYHPTGHIHTFSHYQDYQLHGEQLKYTATGKPLLRLQWNHGVLHGPKVVYRNGTKISEIPYVHGKKHGVETHYDDLGNLTAEIAWSEGNKHGSSRFFTEESTEVEWFYKGTAVNEQKFHSFLERDLLLAEFERDANRAESEDSFVR